MRGTVAILTLLKQKLEAFERLQPAFEVRGLLLHHQTPCALLPSM